MPLPKAIVRPALRIAFRLHSAWVRYRGRPVYGTAVAVWHGAEVLVVRHSYRSGYGLPGGTLRRNEDSSEAARREILEEVGIAIPPDELILVGKETWELYNDKIYEYRPAERPEVRIDNWEIIEARFVDPKAFNGGQRLVGEYLRRAARSRRCRST